jgi:hypothetical protein
MSGLSKSLIQKIRARRTVIFMALSFHTRNTYQVVLLVDDDDDDDDDDYDDDDDVLSVH